MESLTRPNRQSGARTLVSMAVSSQVRVAVVFLLLQAVVLGQSANSRIASIASALRNREFDSALQLLQPALQASPKNPQLWMFQGLAYSGKGDQKAALNSYQNALKYLLSICQRWREQPSCSTRPEARKLCRFCSTFCDCDQMMPPATPCWR